LVAVAPLKPIYLSPGQQLKAKTQEPKPLPASQPARHTLTHNNKGHISAGIAAGKMSSCFVFDSNRGLPAVDLFPNPNQTQPMGGNPLETMQISQRAA